METPLTDAELAGLLPDVVLSAWGRPVEAVEALGGGMNSGDREVRLAGKEYVAKWVPASHLAGLDAGLAAAGTLAEAGLATGAPLPTATGALGVDLASGRLALLAWVPGRPFMGEDPAEQRLIGATLGRAHAFGSPALRPTMRFFAWLDGNAVVLDVEPGLGAEVTAALEEYDALPPLTWGLLHTDPSPEAFRHDATSGDTGLIDWAGSLHGPLLYDVASVVMYLGGSAAAATFTSAYLAAGPLPEHEMAHLGTLWRFAARCRRRTSPNE